MNWSIGECTQGRLYLCTYSSNCRHMIIFYLLLWVISATAPKWISECVINGKSLQDRSTMNEVFICDRIKALSVDDFEQLFAVRMGVNISFNHLQGTEGV
eukprot:GHVH01016390.1.p3 GENE.GHVH01016390.1~~GHVH01016390.1.p3  ORF type:complete len:100 (+),score=14.27 GHVH01016390.1:294-593(+)